MEFRCFPRQKSQVGPCHRLKALVGVVHARIVRVYRRQLLVRQRSRGAFAGLALALSRMTGLSLEPCFALTPLQREDDRWRPEP